jgi:hypothetical protein
MSDVIASVTAMISEIEARFPGTATELSTFPSGAVHLVVRKGDRVLVLAYTPSADWYGVDELSAGEGLGNSYRYGAADFDGARDTLMRLLETA